MKRPRGDDAGFTLVEVVMASLILAIIFPAFAGSMLVVLRLSRDADTQVAPPHAAQSASLAFAADAASATTVAVTDPTSSPCASKGAVVLSFRWADSTGTSYVVDYSKVGAAPYSLHRVLCTATGGSYSLQRDLTIVRTLAAAGAGTPTATSFTGSLPSPTSATLKVTDGSSPAYSFTLTGTRRAA